MLHKCRSDSKFPCEYATEDELTHQLVCRFTGRQFGCSFILSDSDEVIEHVVDETTLNKKNVDSFVFQSYIRQVVSQDFPIEAYTMELVWVYDKYNLQNKFGSIEEYVISTLYLMSEGYGDVCVPNLFLCSHLLKECDLKSVKINKTLITTGNKNWQNVFKTEVSTTSHLFSFKKLKASCNITIKTHEDIMQLYNNKLKEENKYLIDL